MVRLVQALISEHLAPVLRKGADTLVLGCTHYPFLIDEIAARAGAQVVVFDPAPAVARQIARHARQPGAGITRYLTTGDPDRFSEVASTLTKVRVRASQA